MKQGRLGQRCGRCRRERRWPRSVVESQAPATMRKTRHGWRKSRYGMRKTRYPIRKSRYPTRKSRHGMRKTRYPSRKTRHATRKSRYPMRKTRHGMRKTRPERRPAPSAPPVLTAAHEIPLAEARHARRRAVMRLARRCFAVGHGEDLRGVDVFARRSRRAAARSGRSRSTRGVRTGRARRTARWAPRRSIQRSMRSASPRWTMRIDSWISSKRASAATLASKNSMTRRSWLPSGEGIRISSWTGGMIEAMEGRFMAVCPLTAYWGFRIRRRLRGRAPGAAAVPTLVRGYAIARLDGGRSTAAGRRFSETYGEVGGCGGRERCLLGGQGRMPTRSRRR